MARYVYTASDMVKCTMAITVMWPHKSVASGDKHDQHVTQISGVECDSLEDVGTAGDGLVAGSALPDTNHLPLHVVL